MKKIIALLLALTLVAVMVTGCGSKETEVAEEPAKTEEEIIELAEETVNDFIDNCIQDDDDYAEYVTDDGEKAVEDIKEEQEKADEDWLDAGKEMGLSESWLEEFDKEVEKVQKDVTKFEISETKVKGDKVIVTVICTKPDRDSMSNEDMFEALGLSANPSDAELVEKYFGITVAEYIKRYDQDGVALLEAFCEDLVDNLDKIVEKADTTEEEWEFTLVEQEGKYLISDIDK